MPRIRSIKPEFWEDETIALLSRDARLLFIACWNFADDEGLLRWTEPFLRANAFMYDEDVQSAEIRRWMDEIVERGLVFPYVGGKAQQKLAWIINFQKHQRPNRPQPSKLPPPCLQNTKVALVYAARDGWTCHLCSGAISPERPKESDPNNWISLDHVKPRSKGGSDYPSNIRLAHVRCNKRRGPRSLHESLNESVNRSVTDSLLDMEGEREIGEEGLEPSSPPAEDDSFADFWKFYPPRNGKKVDKQKAQRVWAKVSSSKRDLALAGVRHYADACNAGMTLAKDAHRWLRDECWTDWQSPARASPIVRDRFLEATQIAMQASRGEGNGRAGAADSDLRPTRRGISSGRGEL